MSHIMLDIETAGVGADAAIVAIGAAHFDNLSVKKEFYMIVRLESSVKSGGNMDASTVCWWMKQNALAKSIFNAPVKTDHKMALMEFGNWLEELCHLKELRVWGNGAAFDNVILSNAYRREGMYPPWHFWNDRCYRTVKNLYPDVKFEMSGTAHVAVDDARSQALHLIKIIQRYSIELK